MGDAVEFACVCLNLISLQDSVIFDVLRVLANLSHLIKQALDFLRIYWHREIFSLWRLMRLYEFGDSSLNGFHVFFVYNCHDQMVNVRLPLKLDLFYSLSCGFDKLLIPDTISDRSLAYRALGVFYVSLFDFRLNMLLESL